MGNRALYNRVLVKAILEALKCLKNSVFEASKLVSTKTLLLKHYYRHEGFCGRCDTPPQKGYLSDTCVIPYKNKARRVRYSPLGCYLERVSRDIGGVSRIGLLSPRLTFSQYFAIVSSKTKGPGEQGAAGYCPKILLLKRAKMVLCPFHRSHREICARNRPVSETKFLLMISGGPFLSWPLCFTAEFGRPLG